MTTYAADLLAKLDPEQKAAVLHVGEPALVLAGAGSGKTRVITHRIARLVKAMNVPPSGILAVTFTNKAAGEMKERLEAMDVPGAGEMWVHTFHRACSRMLRIDGGAIGLPRGFTVADYQDQVTVLKRAMQDKGAAPPGMTPEAALAMIGRWKDELVRPGDFDPSGYEELYVSDLYRAYQASLRRDNLLDFDDLLMETERLLRERPEVLARCRARFAHLLVDEFQDTNSVQYLITRMLAGEGQGLFIVGDEDQSIYRWRGAAPGNFRRFREDFPRAKTFFLERNYRSTPVILQAAGRVIERNAGRTPKTLKASRRGGDRLIQYTAESDDGEAAWVVGRIRGLLSSRYAPEQVAVLYRVNAQSPPFERALAAEGIAYRLVGGTKFFARQEIKDLLAYLRLALNPDDDPSFRRAVNIPPRGIGLATVEALEMAAALDGSSLHRAARRLAGEGSAAGRKLDGFAALVEKLAAAAPGLDPAGLLHLAAAESGYLEWLRQGGLREPEERVGNVLELERFLDNLPPASEREEGAASFLDEVALLTDADDDSPVRGVSLMTLHCAKGLEFPVVFMAGMEEGLLPHQRALTDPEELEEERRLCYVGMTRAKDLLFLTNARRRLMYGRPVWNTPSRFLDDISPECLPEEGRPAPAAPARVRRALEEYPVGFRVRHPAFGVGTVLAREGSGENLKLTVSFPGHGRKKLVAALAGFVPLHGD